MNYSKQLARQARESPSVVFFDNNFFRPLINGNFHGQLAKLESDLNTVLKLPCVPWRTASSVMEWIGLNSENLPKPPSFDTKFVEDGNFFACAQRHYQKHYATVPELDSDNLERLSAERRWRVSKEMLGFWDDTMFGILADAALSGWLSPLSSKSKFLAAKKQIPISIPISQQRLSCFCASCFCAGQFDGKSPRLLLDQGIECPANLFLVSSNP